MPTPPGISPLPIQLNPGTWPQDNLQTPQVPGMVSRLDRRNVANTQREYFSLTGNVVLQIGSPTVPSSASFNMQVPAYGDFWMKSIALYVDTTGTNFTSAIPLARLSLVDIRCSYSFFRPYIVAGALAGIAPDVAVGQSADVALGYTPVARSDIPIPYCITRNNALQATITLVDIVNRVNTHFYLICDGWLEYQYASV